MTKVRLVRNNYIIVRMPFIKRANKFSCIGWICELNIPDENPFILLAVSDRYGNIDSERALKIELIKYNNIDYRMKFFSSMSKPIEQYTGISLNDNNWHFLSYVCTGEGEMHYYIDGIECPCEDGLNENNIPYSVAYSRYARIGCGEVWVPYLYRDWQAVRMYRWRYASNLVLNKDWIREIYEEELKILTEEK